MVAHRLSTVEKFDRIIMLEKGVIAEEGSYPNVQACLYKVMQGSVSIYNDYGTEDEYLIGVCSQDKCFGEYGCFSGNPRNAEELFGSMAKQIAMLSKNIEMLRNDI